MDFSRLEKLNERVRRSGFTVRLCRLRFDVKNRPFCATLASARPTAYESEHIAIFRQAKKHLSGLINKHFISAHERGDRHRLEEIKGLGGKKLQCYMKKKNVMSSALS